MASSSCIYLTISVGIILVFSSTSTFFLPSSCLIQPKATWWLTHIKYLQKKKKLIGFTFAPSKPSTYHFRCFLRPRKLVLSKIKMKRCHGFPYLSFFPCQKKRKDKILLHNVWERTFMKKIEPNRKITYWV